jgi:hypothetical protein
MRGGDGGQYLVLNDGTKHPLIGFGTYKVGFIPASASSAASGQTPAGAGPSARECVRLYFVFSGLMHGFGFFDESKCPNAEPRWKLVTDFWIVPSFMETKRKWVQP